MNTLLDQNSFSLDQYEGPLPFLVYLVQKNEIDLSNISLLAITEQYLEYLQKTTTHNLDAGADFIDYTGLLIWLKSKKLVPQGKDEETLFLEELQAPLGILPQLMEYCRFKKVAQELLIREAGEEYSLPKGAVYTREDFAPPLGIERVTLDELQKLFEDLLKKVPEKQFVTKERWTVSDKISFIRRLLKDKKESVFFAFLSDHPTKEEVIITFLGVLELLKMGDLQLEKSKETGDLLFLEPPKGE